MTDNEIIKAFECCENNCDCLGCPKLDSTEGCNGVAEEILDLINRQKEQIEALIAGQETLQKNLAKAIKFEAVKEFAEMLKPMYKVLCVDEGDWYNELDNLVKKWWVKQNEIQKETCCN